jgi:hypothetical protein
VAEQTLLVIDDFYDEPAAARAEALQLEYPITGRFPGRNSENHKVQETMTHVGRVLRRNITCDVRSRDITFFRLTRGSDRGRCDIHVDPSGWAGVCYLNPPEQCYGGTSFFRHRKTGLTRWPTPAEAARLVADGVVEPSPDPRVDDLSYFFIREGEVRENWDELCSIPMQHNRAIFYNAKQFHTITAWDRFGETDETARLTRLFFFNT